MQSLVLECGIYFVNANELSLANLVLSQELNALLPCLDGVDDKVVKEAASRRDSAVAPLVNDAEISESSADPVKKSSLLRSHELAEYSVFVGGLLL